MKKTVFVLILLSVLALQPIGAIADNLALGIAGYRLGLL